MKKILITRKLLKTCEEKVSKTFQATLNDNDELYSQSKVVEMSNGCDGILTSLTDKMDADTINKLPDSIKILSNFAVGFGNIDLDAAKKKGIVVTNTPDVLTDATAEIGILLILGACRRASEGIESAKESGWKWSADYLIGKQLTGARLGILGMGRIGQKIAKIAKSLGMIIHYHNRSKLSDEKEQGATYHDNLKDLMSVSDVSGIPILEVFDDDRVVMGSYSSPAMTVTGSNVGIGIASPESIVHIRHNSSDIDNSKALRIENTAGSSGDYALLQFSVSDANSGKAGIGMVRHSAYGLGDIVFLVDSNSDHNDLVEGDEKMRITHTGYVGIGDSNPASTFESAEPVATNTNLSSTVKFVVASVVVDPLTVKSPSNVPVAVMPPLNVPEWLPEASPVTLPVKGP